MNSSIRGSVLVGVAAVVLVALLPVVFGTASPPARAATMPVAVQPQAQPTPTAPGQPNTYVVKAGDTVDSIAREFGLTAIQLARINVLGDPPRIRPGQRLVLQASAIGPTEDLRGNSIDCRASASQPGAAPAPAAANAPSSQTFVLQPGWNAVFLELAPEPNDIAKALAGLPIACVFTHLGQADRAPRAYHPGSPADTDLYTLNANQAYLLKVNSLDPVPWTLSGRPAVRETTWVPDAVNELGLHVDPSNSPRFGQFLAPSPAHRALEASRLDPSGRWLPVARTDAIRSGEAYRIYSDGPSSYGGPLSVATDLDNRLEFGRTLVERSLRIRNDGSAARIVTVRLLDSATPVPLNYAVYVPQNASPSWVTLNGAIELPAAINSEADTGTFDPDQELELRLAVRRSDIPSGVDLAESVLEVTDGAGARTLVAVSAQPQIAVATDADTQAAGDQPVPSQHAGLWIGTVAVDQVSVANRIVPDLYFDLELAVLNNQVVTSTLPGAGGLAPAGTTVQPVRDVAVPSGSPWRYQAGGPMDNSWTADSFDDSAWSLGNAALGFGNRTVTTAVEPNDESVIYFRQPFTLPVTLDQADLELRLRRDDGAIVYLNGVEVLRSNMPDAGTGGDTGQPLARVSGAEETSFQIWSSKQGIGRPFSYPDPASLLVQGRNVLAAEVHQYIGELSDAAGAAVEPTASEFQFRVLVHVDATGQARLLKEAILMRDPVSGEDILLTDSTAIEQFAGAGLRDGQPVGRRASSAAYDFADEDPAVPGTRLLAGALAEGGTLAITLDLAPSFPTNPFRHTYHPDHDNLKDGDGTSLPDDEAEAYAVARVIRLTLTGADELGRSDPGWGDTVMGGIYRETLTGLHRQPIEAQGVFTLRRASNITALNPHLAPVTAE